MPGRYGSLDTKFEPITYDELIKPLSDAAALHTKTSESLALLDAQNAAMRSYINPETDQQSMNDYVNYSLGVSSVADELMRSGYSEALSRRATDLASQYNSQIKPIELAYNQRAADVTEAQKFNKDGTAIYERNPADISLDEYRSNMMAGRQAHILLGSEIQAEAEKIGGYFSSVILHPERTREWLEAITSGIETGELPEYWETYFHEGYDVNELAAELADPNRRLGALAQVLLQRTGILEWPDLQGKSAGEVGADQRVRQVMGYINGGLHAALGKGKYEIVQDTVTPTEVAAMYRSATTPPPARDDVMIEWTNMGGNRHGTAAGEIKTAVGDYEKLPDEMKRLDGPDWNGEPDLDAINDFLEGTTHQLNAEEEDALMEYYDAMSSHPDMNQEDITQDENYIRQKEARRKVLGMLGFVPSEADYDEESGTVVNAQLRRKVVDFVRKYGTESGNIEFDEITPEILSAAFRNNREEMTFDGYKAVRMTVKDKVANDIAQLVIKDIESMAFPKAKNGNPSTGSSGRADHAADKLNEVGFLWNPNAEKGEKISHPYRNKYKNADDTNYFNAIDDGKVKDVYLLPYCPDQVGSNADRPCFMFKIPRPKTEGFETKYGTTDYFLCVYADNVLNNFMVPVVNDRGVKTGEQNVHEALRDIEQAVRSYKSEPSYEGIVRLNKLCNEIVKALVAYVNDEEQGTGDTSETNAYRGD